MEAAGLVLGVAGLATAFGSCMACFNYIRIGKNFDGDYDYCQLQMEIAGLRLSRWGASMGFTNPDDMVSKLSVSDEHVGIAFRLLEHIARSFEGAKDFSDQYDRDHAPPSWSDGGSTYHANGDASVGHSRLHRKIQGIIRRRQKDTSRDTSLFQKTKWALYQKDSFEKLIKEVTKCVDDLYKLFPSAVEKQQGLCKEEARILEDEEDLSSIADILVEEDPMLEAALKEEAFLRGHDVRNWKAKGGSRVRIGDKYETGMAYRSHFASNFEVSDTADIWIGNGA